MRGSRCGRHGRERDVEAEAARDLFATLGRCTPAAKGTLEWV
jgi:hypothetical protein